MLTFKDFTDYCDLSEDEIRAFSNGANISPIEACALAYEKKASLELYPESAEYRSDATKSYEELQSISNSTLSDRKTKHH